MGDIIPQSIPRTSRAWAVPGSTNIIPAKFPSASPKPTSSDPQEIATSVVNAFNKALQSKDYPALSQLFTEDGFWRDHLALTWSFRTVQGPNNVLDFLKKCSQSKDGFRLAKIDIDATSSVRKPQAIPVDGKGEVQGIQFFFKLETVLGTGLGLARLVEINGQWKIFTFYTRIHDLKGHEETVNEHRPRGVEHGGMPGRKNWAQRRAETAEFTQDDPAVLIVGAGQAGLTAAARLKMLGVEALAIDQNERVGDNWRKRYHQLVLHDPVWYDHMPYLQFPPQWPIFTPKDKLAQFFEAYATLLELNIWMKTSLVDTKWDEASKTWTVTVERAKDDGTTEKRTFHPRHIIQATGHSGKKNMPDMKGISDFKGDRLCHSSEFSGAKDNSQGKKAVVVGSCNSGHDIAQDFLEKGYHVTMVQRSTTHVVSSKAITDIGLKGVYSEDGPPVDDADLLIHGLPIPVFKALAVETTKKQAECDKDILDGLDRAGFKVDRGPDGAGLLMKYFQRGGGYYIDVGASQLIADGKIKVKHGQEIETVLPHGLRFADGSELEADEIVFATGYQNMRTQSRTMFGDAVADKVNDVWGFNEEGEMRTIWQKSGLPGFWFHGGNLAMCRYYSKLLALQIKGLEERLYTYDDI
ncbi:putative flavin-containing monooxygenase [Fusarium sporotrichioides]|uniref:Putative flavin-containing monooxygenase n=1 Tax=Fusarium sporotrichioides TaxID=5514 RepID=A0A395SQK2_FUSSP|nr:putative flavin-containing monooxygenase [Fusarium sporotrichioides]